MASTEFAKSIYDIWLETDYSIVEYTPDPLRYLPELEERKKFHEKLTKEMEKRDYNFFLLSGSYDNRFHQAIQKIDSFLALQDSLDNKDEC